MPTGRLTLREEKLICPTFRGWRRSSGDRTRRGTCCAGVSALMEKTIYGYVWKHSPRQQITLTVMAVVSFPFLYAFYELPKMIINQAIGGKNIEFPYDFYGMMEWDQVTFLFVLCGAFLALVLVNQAFKYVINVYKGLTGERMLRRLRYELYSRVLRFPMPTFRKMSQGEIIPMVTAEVEPLGGFIGDATSLPAFQGGTLLTILGFLFIQDWRMALAAVLLYPLQVWLIPKLQKRVNLLGKERVRRVRKLSERIGETVSGVQEVHVHDASNYVLTDFATQLGGIFEVRYQIYRQKFVIKFLNNFIQQLGPFFFYSIGGYFVIQGELEIGTLVAAIAAHKDLAAPWKELLTYYQMQADATIKYDQVVSQFGPAGMRDAENQLGEPETIEPLRGEIAASNLSLVDDQDVSVIDGASFRLPLDKRTAVLGAGSSGKEELGQLIARLIDPDKGTLQIAGQDAAGLYEAVTGRRMAYVGQGAFIFAGTLADNLYLGLKHRPLKPRELEGDAQAEFERFVSEAERSGNLAYDYGADWIDYEAAGAKDAGELSARGLWALELAGLGEDVYAFGLRGTIDPDGQPELADNILRARKGLQELMANDAATAGLIETFDRNSYNTNASVGENLLFGNPVGDAFDMERLAEHPYVLEVLDKAGLSERFLQAGYQVAATTVELFADLPSDHELFQQYSFISADDLPDVQALLQRADRNNLAGLSDEDRGVLLSLPFKLVPARHRLGIVDDAFKAQLLEARALFADNLPEELQGSVEFFDVDQYNRAANLQDNILFGKLAYGQAEAAERVGELVRRVVDELALKETVAEVGLAYDVGIAGARLSSAQRQKLAIARAVIKRPDVLILSEATAALDSASQTLIQNNLLQEFEGRCLIWIVHRADMARSFDHVLVMRGGRIAEFGPLDEVDKDGSHFRELVQAE